ncbi:MAG TPA: hypothetical protein VGL89_04365 [Candidatus Koribacter sp.]|jgi:hypothetical protein
MKRIWILTIFLALPLSAQENDHAGMTDSAMAMHEMHSSTHMQMTELRTEQPGDRKKADEVAGAAKAVMAKYTDYKAAEADGFRPFLPNVKQKMVHFTNYRYAMEAAFGFNPEHPTSLLYEPVGTGYRLIGVMYTAPFRFSPDQLNERVPLSIAQWHVHINLCMPPAGERDAALQAHPKFGINGAISTENACTEAGGTFHPHVFGWMVHVYPNEQDPSRIWSVERQMGSMD